MLDINAERARELLEYDQETGIFRWKISRGNGAAFGAVAGFPDRKGYIQIRVNGRRYPAHRLAWLITHGEWPADQLDHMNGIKDDNRLANLRPATGSQNQRNRGKQVGNKSGYKGVSWHKCGQKFQATIRYSGSNHHLGLFNCPIAAAQAYNQAALEFHGDFAVLNEVPGNAET